MRRPLVIVLCALALGACVPPPVDVDRVPNFDPKETIMGQIQERGVLRVGVPDYDIPPFWFDPESKLVGAGFLVGLSQEIGSALAVDVEFVPLNEEDLILPGRPKVETPVELSFVQLPATQELAKAHPLTHPYWVAHQRLLVASDSGTTSIDDLPTGAVVCSIVDEETGVAPSALNEGVDDRPSDLDGCAEALDKGKVDAVTAPDHVLMSVWARITDCRQPCEPSPDYEIVGDELTTAGYSAMLPLGSPGWTNFVNSTWGEMESEGRWMEFYEEWIAPYGIELDEAPRLRMEEAAGLFPCVDC